MPVRGHVVSGLVAAPCVLVQPSSPTRALVGVRCVVIIAVTPILQDEGEALEPTVWACWCRDSWPQQDLRNEVTSWGFLSVRCLDSHTREQPLWFGYWVFDGVAPFHVFNLGIKGLYGLFPAEGRDRRAVCSCPFAPRSS